MLKLGAFRAVNFFGWILVLCVLLFFKKEKIFGERLDVRLRLILRHQYDSALYYHCMLLEIALRFVAASSFENLCLRSYLHSPL